MVLYVVFAVAEFAKIVEAVSLTILAFVFGIAIANVPSEIKGAVAGISAIGVFAVDIHLIAVLARLIVIVVPGVFLILNLHRVRIFEHALH